VRDVAIDVGCGARKVPGTLGVDIIPIPGVDAVADLERGLPLATNSVDTLHCYHLLEHVADYLGAMGEIWRVLKPGGKAHIRVPHAASPYMTWKDPTHRRGLSLATFTYFDDTYFDGRVFSYYSPARFRIEVARLCFTAQGPPAPIAPRSATALPPVEPHGITVARRVLNPLVHALANRSRGWQYACERFWGPWIGIEELYVVLCAIKDR
jgi:SAM-dependent methyltransferase